MNLKKNKQLNQDLKNESLQEKSLEELIELSINSKKIISSLSLNDEDKKEQRKTASLKIANELMSRFLENKISFEDLCKVTTVDDKSSSILDVITQAIATPKQGADFVRRLISVYKLDSEKLKKLPASNAKKILSKKIRAIEINQKYSKIQANNR